MIGDYGEIFWVDREGGNASRAGGGGYGDYTDGVVRSIKNILVVYPPEDVNYGESAYDADYMFNLPLTSGNDTIYGNGARDVIFGCGGEHGKIKGGLPLLAFLVNI